MKIRSFSDNEIPSFTELLVAIPNFLPEESFTALKKEIESVAKVSRGHVPMYRKGGAISYETLRAHVPSALELYHSPDHQHLISTIVGTKVVPTPEDHPNSLSVLVYDQPGDHIAWHHDKNYYRGRYFTVLLAIENRGHGEDGLSSLQLLVKKPTGDVIIPTPPNTLILFEGSKVLHRTTQLKEGERRVLLSKTYSTDPRYSFTKNILRRIKDASFFGLDSLWK
ncbi:MAG TPA: phytanoyl-CoA dioxygenase family protein [Candidatus Andersenbacteria bacterium]|nr:phytanoyl-CoA dioxygenase family protein [Candidatus Andersenbacteria bacterium]